jgi:hypothetical protein
MIHGSSSSLQSLDFSLDYSRRRSAEVHHGKDDSGSVSQLNYAESLDFSLDFSRTMQVMEGESRRAVSESMSLEFSLSYEYQGQGKGGGGPEELMKKFEDMMGFGQEDDSSSGGMAGRVLDFIKGAMGFAEEFGEGLLEQPEGRQRFADVQRDAVNRGFSRARDILPEQMPKEHEDGIQSALNQIMEGLDSLFSFGMDEKDDEEEMSLMPPPHSGEASFYSSESFSLSFEVEIEASGNFNPKELNSFVEDSFAQVMDFFSDFMGGDEEKEDKQNKGIGFDPKNLFSPVFSGKVFNLLNSD